MAKNRSGGNESRAPDEEKIPLGQVLFDDIFFLLALGLAIPLILYTVWGVFDLTLVPPLVP